MTYETITISAEGGETSASFIPALNMVCCSLGHRGVERLAFRRGLDAYARQGKTMGIPLL
jgi:aldose 1-epimerase